MQAYGGVLGIEATCKNAVGIIESGPAAGIVGTRFLGEHIGEKNILATDMGGTTFKVSLVRDGVIERDYKPVILRYNILSTKIWVESIGAGGGSIAWIDPETGLLKVGPQGAGASPGPVCYDIGGSRADGFRCRSGSRLSQRKLFSRRQNEAEQSQDAGRDEGKNRASRSI